MWENVAYQPGTLSVKVKRKGHPWATARRVTTGESKRVTAETDRSTIKGDAQDLAYIALALVDKKGNVVPTDCRDVEFDISGPAELVGFCNGNQTDHTCMQSKQQSFFNGRIVAIVRGKRNSTGKAIVSVKADGLDEIKVPITISDTEDLKEEEKEENDDEYRSKISYL